MSTHANMVKMTVSSVGADPYTITLNAASSGFQSFADAYGANATVDILITQGTVWEVARNCTYTHSGTTVTRGTFEDSSTGSRITTFDNTAVVSVIATADFGNRTENVIGAFGSSEISVTGAVTATIGRMHICTGTSANYPVTLPAVSGNTGKLVGLRMGSATGLTKLVVVTTGADAVTKTGTVTGSTTTLTAGAGTVSTSGSSTTLTGSGTAFDTALRVGDTLYIAGQTSAVYVAAIASATSLTMSAARTVSASTAYSYVKTGIAGSSTLFTTEYTVGDGFTVGSDTREIVYIASNTALGLDEPFLTAPSGSAHGRTTTTIDGEYNRIMWASEAATLMCDGTNWFKIAGKSRPMIGVIKLNTTQSIATGSSVKVTLGTLQSDNTGLIVDTSGQRLVCRRTGNYVLTGKATIDATTTIIQVHIYVAAALVIYSKTQFGTSELPGAYAQSLYDVTAGTAIELYARHEHGTNRDVYGSTGYLDTFLSMQEVPSW